MTTSQWRIRVSLAIFLSVAPLVLLQFFQIPLGKPNTLVYPYSKLDAVRLFRISAALPFVAMIAAALFLSASKTRLGRIEATFLFVLGLVGVGLAPLVAAPKWSSQNYFNMISPSHDGAFLTESQHVRSVGLHQYLQEFDRRAATPPEQMRGTRVISNPPGATLVAYFIESIFLANPPVSDWFEAIAVDDPRSPPETRRIASLALAYAVMMIALWVAGACLLGQFARPLLGQPAALFLASAAAITPMSLLFIPGKDTAQMFTLGLMVAAWLRLLRRPDLLWAGLFGVFVVIGLWFSLVHVWVGLILAIALFVSMRPVANFSRIVRLALCMAIATAIAIGLCKLFSGYDVLSSSLAIARAQNAVTRGPDAMPLSWQLLGIPLALLFCGPLLWLALLVGTRGRNNTAALSTAEQNSGFDAPARYRRAGRLLIYLTLGVSIFTVGFTNIETPRLWIPFGVLLSVGVALMFDFSAMNKSKARVLALLILMQAIVSFWTWSRMDMRETELRTLSMPGSKPRFLN